MESIYRSTIIEDVNNLLLSSIKEETANKEIIEKLDSNISIEHKVDFIEKLLRREIQVKGLQENTIEKIQSVYNSVIKIYDEKYHEIILYCRYNQKTFKEIDIEKYQFYSNKIEEHFTFSSKIFKSILKVRGLTSR